MDISTIALIGGGLLAVNSTRKKRVKTTSSKFAVSGPEDRVKFLQEIVSMSSWYSNKYSSMPYLADFLVVTGYIESRFNPSVINTKTKDVNNAARGLFGMRPKTAFKGENGLEHMLAHPNALLNPRWSFVCAVYHTFDACRTVQQRGTGAADWKAIRRWWGYPDKIHDFTYSYDWSVANLAKFQAGIRGVNEDYGTNISAGFLDRKISGWQRYPGMETMVKSFGLQGVYS